jgi:hypothetical protein
MIAHIIPQPFYSRKLRITAATFGRILRSPESQRLTEAVGCGHRIRLLPTNALGS